MSTPGTPDISKIPVLSCQDQYAEWAIQVEASAGVAGIWCTFNSTNNTYLGNAGIDITTKRACGIGQIFSPNQALPIRILKFW